jgi:hypothetical protein
LFRKSRNPISCTPRFLHHLRDGNQFIKRAPLRLLDWRWLSAGLALEIPAAFWPFIGLAGIQWWDSRPIIFLAIFVSGSLALGLLGLSLKGPMDMGSSLAISLNSFLLGAFTLYSLLSTSIYMDHAGMDCQAALAGAAGASLQSCTTAQRLPIVEGLLILSLIPSISAFVGSSMWFGRKRTHLALARRV